MSRTKRGEHETFVRRFGHAHPWESRGRARFRIFTNFTFRFLHTLERTYGLPPKSGGFPRRTVGSEARGRYARDNVRGLPKEGLSLIRVLLRFLQQHHV